MTPFTNHHYRIFIRGIVLTMALIFCLLQGFACSSLQLEKRDFPRRLPPATTPKEPKVVPGEVIVKYRDDSLPDILNLEQRDQVLKKAANTFAEAFGSQVIATYPQFGWIRLKVQPGNETAIIDYLLEDKERNQIEYARPNYEVTLYSHINPPPNDYLWITHFYSSPDSFLWGLEKIGMIDAWKLSHTQGGGVIIAVLDSGLDRLHPDIIDNYHPGSSYCGSGITDTLGHGTMVAGIIGARGDNYVSLSDMKFFVGVNRIAQLMAVKIDCGGAGPNIVDATNGILYAITHGASIINGSWGIPTLPHNDPYVVALKSAIEAGRDTTLIVVAAGNGHQDLDTCPSPTLWPQMFNLPNLVVVAATDKADELWIDRPASGQNPCEPNNYPLGSNYGKTAVHLAAPGNDIWSTGPVAGNGSTGDPLQDFPLIGSGTSGSAPFVAGCGALVQSRQLAFNPGSTLSPSQLKSLLMTTGTSIPAISDKVASGNRLNCYGALLKVHNPPPSNPENLRVQ